MRELFWYWVWVFKTLRADLPQNFYIVQSKGREETKWERRIGTLKTTDGPIHTLWVWQARLRYNWFTLGFVCWRKGHDNRDQFIATSAGRDLVKGESGLKFVSNGKTIKHYISACRRCGHYRGTWSVDSDDGNREF